MDFDTMKAVGDNPGFTTSETVTLLCLAWHHNESTGFAWPSVPAIAAWTGLAVNTIRPTLRTLESAGCIHRTDRAGTSPQYRFDRTAIVAYTPPKTGRGRTPTKIGTTKTVTPTKIGSTPPPELEGAPLPKLGDDIRIETSNEISNNGAKPVQTSLTDAELPDWYTSLVMMSDQVPEYAKCRKYVDGVKADDATCYTVTIAMQSRLRYDTRKHAWVGMAGGKNTSYANIWATFQNWLRRELRGLQGSGYAPRGRKEPTTDSAELAKDPW